MPSSDPGSQVIVRSERSVVRVLCMVRLVVLVASVLLNFFEGGLPFFWVIALLAAPFSLAPALTWDTRGVLYSRSGILLAADMVMSVIVMMSLVGSDMQVAFGAATVALWATINSARMSLLLAMPICMVVVVGADIGPRTPMWQIVSGIAGIITIAWAGGALGTSLRAQDAAAAELAEEQVARAAASERMRLARDLHDSVTGDLAGLHLLAGHLRERLDRASVPAEDRELLRGLEEALAETHRRTRVALTDLRESAADPADSASELIDRWKRRTGIAVEAEVAAGFSRVDPELWSQVQAVLLELLENVRKHAEATRVRIALSGCTSGSAEIVVEDDGVGITASALEGRVEAAGHFGVAGIRARASEYGGQAEWSTGAKGGTVVHVLFGDDAAPLPRAKDNMKEGLSAHPDG